MQQLVPENKRLHEEKKKTTHGRQPSLYTQFSQLMRTHTHTTHMCAHTHASHIRTHTTFSYATGPRTDTLSKIETFGARCPVSRRTFPRPDQRAVWPGVPDLSAGIKQSNLPNAASKTYPNLANAASKQTQTFQTPILNLSEGRDLRRDRGDVTVSSTSQI